VGINTCSCAITGFNGKTCEIPYCVSCKGGVCLGANVCVAAGMQNSSGVGAFPIYIIIIIVVVGFVLLVLATVIVAVIVSRHRKRRIPEVVQLQVKKG